MSEENQNSHPPIFTVGYGANDISWFVGLLHRLKIAFLIDVRSKPYSKHQPEYSRLSFERQLKNENIRYVFMGDQLGGFPEDRDCYINGRVDYEKCRSKQFYQNGIGRLRAAWEQQLRVALMCACGKPERCHRTKLIGESLKREGIPVSHLDDKGNVFDQKDIESKLEAVPDLFGIAPQTAFSRKKYKDE